MKLLPERISDNENRLEGIVYHRHRGTRTQEENSQRVLPDFEDLKQAWAEGLGLKTQHKPLTLNP